jgi:7-cyano-7-deazaguanine synthase
MGSLMLLSGGQDSTTALFDALARDVEVRACIFDYGQEHVAECSAAAKIAMNAGVEFEITPIPRLRLGPAESPVVPVRNSVLLALAANRAVDYGLDQVVIGCCADDADLFPDCRPDFLDTFEQLMATSGVELRVEAPLVQMDKAAIFRLASELGVLDVILEETRTCYRGLTDRHEWGMGCGECLACTTRARGWKAYLAD